MGIRVTVHETTGEVVEIPLAVERDGHEAVMAYVAAEEAKRTPTPVEVIDGANPEE